MVHIIGQKLLFFFPFKVSIYLITTGVEMESYPKHKWYK